MMMAIYGIRKMRVINFMRVIQVTNKTNYPNSKCKELSSTYLCPKNLKLSHTAILKTA